MASIPENEATNGTTQACFPFCNTYTGLPEHFYARTIPTRVREPRLLKLNDALAEQLGLDISLLRTPEALEVLAGNRIAAGSEPIALAYAGHQFGNFVPSLGDGRANLLGEIIGHDGIRYDVQLKGSGRSAFSRRGDGRAAVGPVLREYILSEAMAALGIPTTRSLAAVATGEPVFRENVLPGAVLTRIAQSHIRVGTFEYFAARRDTEALRALTNYATKRHYAEVEQADRPVHAFLHAVIERQAKLVAQWMMVGFIHGVMNTDNTSISGETIDYGPCAFMEAYDPATVFSSIDQNGHYAYGNQPRIMMWNLARLAESLLPLLAEETDNEDAALQSAQDSLATFATHYDAAQLAGLRKKLGLQTQREEDSAIAFDLLDRMQQGKADFTLTFRKLCEAAIAPANDQAVRELFSQPTTYDEWAQRWRERISLEDVSPDDRAAAMRQVNPAIIPRNHQVEAALSAASSDNNLEPFEMLLKALSRPYENRPEFEAYTHPARPEERVLYTFCGT